MKYLEQTIRFLLIFKTFMSINPKKHPELFETTFDCLRLFGKYNKQLCSVMSQLYLELRSNSDCVTWRKAWVVANCLSESNGSLKTAVYFSFPYSK